DAGQRAPPAQQRWREGTDQGRQDGPGDLAGEAGEGAPDGSRRAMDGEVLRVETGPRWHGAAGHRDPDLSVTRRTVPSIAVTASFGARSPPMRSPMTEPVCTR